MPVIVVGADTPIGDHIVRALAGRDGEVRAFVTDPDLGLELKERGVKVAIGDVSDASHIGGAALNCFSAVLVPTAATDDRERSFAEDPGAVLDGWADALRDGGVTRGILVADAAVPDAATRVEAAAPEFALVETVGRTAAEVAAEVARIDDLAALP